MEQITSFKCYADKLSYNILKRLQNVLSYVMWLWCELPVGWNWQVVSEMSL